jgi:hypothetical protein
MNSFDDSPDDANPMIARVKERHARETRRLRSLATGMIAAVLARLLAGAGLHGMNWLRESLSGLGLAGLLGMLMIMHVWLEEHAGLGAVGQGTPLRDLLGRIIGAAVICVLIYLVHRTWTIFELRRDQTIWQLTATCAAFLLAFPWGHRIWGAFAGSRPQNATRSNRG